MRGCRAGTGRADVLGDGATNIGTFHESLNMAALWTVPVVFIVENNLYGEYTPLRDSTPLDDLAERAASYAMPGESSMDRTSTRSTRALEGSPARAARDRSLLEMKTYRYRGHSRTDPANTARRGS